MFKIAAFISGANHGARSVKVALVWFVCGLENWVTRVTSWQQVSEDERRMSRKWASILFVQKEARPEQSNDQSRLKRGRDTWFKSLF